MDDTMSGGSEDTMQGDTGASTDTNTDEPVSVFLPKAAFGDKPPKVGDDLSAFKIVDVDPESGDAEARCSYDNTEPDKQESMDQSFDRAMPNE